MQNDRDYAPEMFDENGQIAPPVSADDHGRMSPDRQAIYDNLHAAIANERAKDQAVKDAMDAIKSAQAFADQKQKALTKLAGVTTAHDVWRRDVAKIESNPHDPETVQAIKAAQDEHDNAREAVQIAQQAYTSARHAVPLARALVANALKAYVSRYPVKTGVEAIKDHITRTNLHQQAAKDAYVANERQIASVLDAHLQGGRGGAGIRSSRQAQRGAFPSHMRGQAVPGAAPIDSRKPTKPPSDR